MQGDPDQYQVLEGVRLKAESELRELATPEEWCGSLCSDLTSQSLPTAVRRNSLPVLYTER